MADPWPWLALAGAGALHGLNPAAGWLPAAACSLRAGDRHALRRALPALAAGHALAVALVAAAVALLPALQQGLRPAIVGAAALLLVALAGRSGPRPPGSGRLGLALWSFIASTLHGSGLMLVPALVPLCLGDSPARAITASGSLPLALLAVAVHALAMLASLALAACGAVHGAALLHRLRARA